MSETIYRNQQKAANEIFHRFSKTNTVLLTAEAQSGKTGVCIELMNKLYDKHNGLVYFLYFGPSDSVLRKQTRERLIQYPKINISLIGGKVYHHPNLYSTNEGREMRMMLSSAIQLGRPVYVIHDEAHIGIKKDQKVEKFYNDLFGNIPGSDEHKDNVFYLMVSATPFSQDHKGDFEEVYLQPGDSYIGVRNFIKAGRLKEAFPVLRGRKKAETLKNYQELFQSYIDNIDKGYFVIRDGTTSMLTEKAVASLPNAKYTVFNSRNKNIKDFEIKLSQEPDKLEFLFVQQSYKQGKTLNKDYVVCWYEYHSERKSSKGRSDADLIQSVGRNFGYNANVNYDIYTNVDSLKKAADYYAKAELADYKLKRAMPLSDSATKHSIKKARNVQQYFYSSREDAEQAVESFGYKPYVMTCSRNNETDMATTVANCSVRQSGGKRLNIYHLDSPNENFQESWNVLDKSCHGSFVVNLPIGYKQVVNTNSTSMWAEASK